jgi:predicted amidophosphoribosyltransferase
MLCDTCGSPRESEGARCPYCGTEGAREHAVAVRVQERDFVPTLGIRSIFFGAANLGGRKYCLPKH